jgi:hypothetical protein
MPVSAPKGWDRFHELDAAPHLSPLTFIGRAVTPPYRPRRFDARFFMADAEEALIDERPPVDGAELSDLQWVTLDDAQAPRPAECHAFHAGRDRCPAESEGLQGRPAFPALDPFRPQHRAALVQQRALDLRPAPRH